MQFLAGSNNEELDRSMHLQEVPFNMLEIKIVWKECEKALSIDKLKHEGT